MSTPNTKTTPQRTPSMSFATLNLKLQGQPPTSFVGWLQQSTCLSQALAPTIQMKAVNDNSTPHVESEDVQSPVQNPENAVADTSHVNRRINLIDADRAGDELAVRLGGTLIADVLHGKVNSVLAADSGETEHTANDRRYLPPNALLKLYQNTMAFAIVDAAVKCDHPIDPVLGIASSLVSTGAAIPKRCGDVLSDNLAGALDVHPDFVVLREVVVPITQKALNSSKLKMRRADKRKNTKRRAQNYKGSSTAKLTHRVDMLVFDRRRGTVHVIESKRGAGQSDAGQIARTTVRLLAIEKCLVSHLESVGIMGVTNVKSLVVDHYGRSGFRHGLNISGGAFDEAFGVRGVDEAMAKLESRLSKETAGAMWGETLKTMSAFMDAGYGSEKGKAIPRALIDKLKYCEGAPSMETPVPIDNVGSYANHALVPALQIQK